MTTGQQPLPPTRTRVTHQSSQASIKKLFTQLSKQFTAIIRGEIELTRIKAIRWGRKFAVGGVLAAAGAVLLLYMFGWLLHAAQLALSLVLAPWAASLIVACVLFVIAAILIFVGVRLIMAAIKITPAPQEEIRKDVVAIKKGLGK